MEKRGISVQARAWRRGALVFKRGHGENRAMTVKALAMGREARLYRRRHGGAINIVGCIATDI